MREGGPDGRISRDGTITDRDEVLFGVQTGVVVATAEIRLQVVSRGGIPHGCSIIYWFGSGERGRGRQRRRRRRWGRRRRPGGEGGEDEARGEMNVVGGYHRSIYVRRGRGA